MADDAYRAHTEQFYWRRVNKITDDLRALAEQIQRDAKPYKRGVGNVPRYTAAAERTLHALTWGLANMGAHYLVSAAGEADEAERT